MIIVFESPSVSFILRFIVVHLVWNQIVWSLPKNGKEKSA